MGCRLLSRADGEKRLRGMGSTLSDLHPDPHRRNALNRTPGQPSSRAPSSLGHRHRRFVDLYSIKSLNVRMTLIFFLQTVRQVRRGVGERDDFGPKSRLCRQLPTFCDRLRREGERGECGLVGITMDFQHSGGSPSDCTDRAIVIPSDRILVRRLPRVMPRIFAAWNWFPLVASRTRDSRSRSITASASA